MLLGEFLELVESSAPVSLYICFLDVGESIVDLHHGLGLAFLLQHLNMTFNRLSTALLVIV